MEPTNTPSSDKQSVMSNTQEPASVQAPAQPAPAQGASAPTSPISAESKNWIAVGGAVAIIALGVALFMLLSGGGVATEERVGDTVYKKTDLSKVSGADAVPAGLPPGLPLETDRVLESTVSRPDSGEYELSAYTYLSLVPAKQLYASYLRYVVTEGYILESSSTGSGLDEVHSFSATKDGNDLGVVISTVGGDTRVQVIYLNRD